MYQKQLMGPMHVFYEFERNIASKLKDVFYLLEERLCSKNQKISLIFDFERILIFVGDKPKCGQE